MQLLVGARLITLNGFDVIAYPTDRAAYGRLCRLLTLGNRRAKKGECHLSLADVISESDGQVFIVMPPRTLGGSFTTNLSTLAEAARDRTYLGAASIYANRNAARLSQLDQIAKQQAIPLVATNDVLYHAPERQVLQDVLTCVREKTTIAEAGKRLNANAERYLKAPAEMARLFAKYPDAMARTLEIANRVRFSLDELRYEYPDNVIGGGVAPQETLARLTWEGAATRYPAAIPDKVRKLLDYELALIAELKYAPYFLTVWDIMEYAKSRHILCQGRGSAANSAVCFVLGITAVDPMQMDLLFERFVSTERDEPPDIDVDFEHERREEVIQHIYEKYGRERAGIAATVITYRAKSAIRDVGKALGLSEDTVGILSGNLFGWGRGSIDDAHVKEVGLDSKDQRLALALNLARELVGFPRHLSQHVGGFVITRGPLEEMIPIGNAAMDDRTFVEWDKDDLDALGILKIDVLALGMLTCIAKCFSLIEKHYGRKLDLADVPHADAATYEMLCQGNSLGVFQVESRAQMSMLPKLKPRMFFDLVIEVAIVRPGPIQGDMVHPYLRRRDGIDPVTYPTEELREVLKHTLGVPLFQEQVMKIAIVAAGFTPAEADRLRRAMATFKRMGTIQSFRDKFILGMVQRGYTEDFADRCFRQVEGFGNYGFPMSHAASFALLVYVSAWLRCHYPDAFCASILNAQPMGFYAPAQLVRDAIQHGVEVCAPDINSSAWDNILEDRTTRFHPVRLGFRQIKGFREADADALVAARGDGFDGVRHLALVSGLASVPLTQLAQADGFRSLGLDRRQALWAVKGLDGGAENARIAPAELPLFELADPEALRREEEVRLPPMRPGEHVVHDYMTMQLSLKAHPLRFLRSRMAARHVTPNITLTNKPNGASVTVSGLVLVRQRPGTASGVIFVTLEDEGGIANIIVWPSIFEAHRRTLLGSRLLMVSGKLQRQELVMHVIAEKLVDLTSDLSLLSADHGQRVEATARADEVKRPGHDLRGASTPHTGRGAPPSMPRSRDFR